jgi:hypothetical protein
LVLAYSTLLPAGPLYWAAGLLLFLIGAALAGGLVLLLTHLLLFLVPLVPPFYRWAFVVALLLTGFPFLGSTTGQALVAGAVVLTASLAGAGAASLARGRGRRLTRTRRAVAVAGLILGLAGLLAGSVWLLSPGWAVEAPPDLGLRDASVPHLGLPDPSLPGDYEVRTLTYGSGTDPHRPEYGADADLRTEPVDGSPFVSNWSDLRTHYWGFDEDALPRNARVWYPEGAGAAPSPLVLVVHGNHLMSDFSDAGYGYLGELLAGRGFIVASVDENFLNGSAFADFPEGLSEENDARGWLLLEHLRLWRAWNEEPGNPFYGKVDLERVALIGHSRGGEAVTVAAAFNRLPAYPGDATVKFDYDFGLRSVVALAPVDGQYEPAGRSTPLEDVNYLVLQGAHDMDVSSFDGLNPYARLTFTDGSYFKAALYVYGANHGQFNTSWGRSDLPSPTIWLFNRRQLMEGEEQRRVAQVYVSAFLEATLHGAEGYVPLFRDYRVGEGWLPETIYLNAYADSETRYVATFEEDLDVTTTTWPGGRAVGWGLDGWQEDAVPLKWESMDTHAVRLGWDGKASYELELPRAVEVDAGDDLVFSLADASREEDDEDEDEGLQPIDLTVEVGDAGGRVAHLPLSNFAPLQPQLEAHIAKAPFLARHEPSEPVFQRFTLPLAAFVAENPELDVGALSSVRFVFDRTEEGAVFLDDVGFAPGG